MSAAASVAVVTMLGVAAAAIPFMEWLRDTTQLRDEKLSRLVKDLDDEDITSVDDLRHQIDSGYWPKLCSSCRSLTLGVIPKIEAAVPKRARVAESASENTLDCSEASDDKQTDREHEQFPPAK